MAKMGQLRIMSPDIDVFNVESLTLVNSMEVIIPVPPFPPKRRRTGNEPWTDVDFQLFGQSSLNTFVNAIKEGRIELSGVGDIKVQSDIEAMIGTGGGTVTPAPAYKLAVGVTDNSLGNQIQTDVKKFVFNTQALGFSAQIVPGVPDVVYIGPKAPYNSHFNDTDGALPGTLSAQHANSFTAHISGDPFDGTVTSTNSWNGTNRKCVPIPSVVSYTTVNPVIGLGGDAYLQVQLYEMPVMAQFDEVIPLTGNLTWNDPAGFVQVTVSQYQKVSEKWEGIVTVTLNHIGKTGSPWVNKSGWIAVKLTMNNNTATEGPGPMQNIHNDEFFWASRGANFPIFSGMAQQIEYKVLQAKYVSGIQYATSISLKGVTATIQKLQYSVSRTTPNVKITPLGFAMTPINIQSYNVGTDPKIIGTQDYANGHPKQNRGDAVGAFQFEKLSDEAGKFIVSKESQFDTDLFGETTFTKKDSLNSPYAKVIFDNTTSQSTPLLETFTDEQYRLKTDGNPWDSKQFLAQQEGMVFDGKLIASDQGYYNFPVVEPITDFAVFPTIDSYVQPVYATSDQKVTYCRKFSATNANTFYPRINVTFTGDINLEADMLAGLVEIFFVKANGLGNVMDFTKPLWAHSTRKTTSADGTIQSSAGAGARTWGVGNSFTLSFGSNHVKDGVYMVLKMDKTKKVDSIQVEFA